MSRKKIEDLVDEKIDIKFDYAEISDKIDLKRYENKKPSFQRRFRPFAALAALAAVLVFTVSVIGITTIGGKNNFAPSADNGVNFEDMTKDKDSSSAGKPAGEPSSSANVGQTDSQVAPAEAPQDVPYSANVGQIDSIAVPDEEPAEEPDTDYAKISINGAIARLIMENGEEYEITDDVIFQDKSGREITLDEFENDERVAVSVSDPESDREKAIVIIKKIK